MDLLKLRLLGTPGIEVGGTPIKLERRKSMALLIYLALNSRPCPRDELATLLTPDAETEDAYRELRRSLAALNKSKASAWIMPDRDVITFRYENCQIDALEFDTQLQYADDSASLESAIALYRGSFLEGFYLRNNPVFEEWQTLQAQIYQQRLMRALERLSDTCIAHADLERGLRAVERLLSLDPFDEYLHQRAMTLLTMTGQRSAALKHYEIFAERLNAEIGAQPQPETTQLFEQIKSEQPVTPLLQSDSIISLPPRPALMVGRDEVVRDIRAAIGVGAPSPASGTTLVLQGWPGIGKSSLMALLAHDALIHHHFTDGVLWISLGQTTNLLSLIKSWAALLGLNVAMEMDSPEKISAMLAGILKNRKMLLLIDDVWNESHFTLFNVGGEQCATVISTRANEVAQRIAPTPDAIYKLPLLTVDQSMELLHSLAPRVVEANTDAIRQLAHDLEGLPLALQVAGRLLHSEMEMGWGIADLLQDLQAGVRLLSERAPAALPEVAQQTTPTIAALLQRSTQELDEETRLRFALLGAFAPKPAVFDFNALQAVWEVDDPKPTARILVGRGLMEPCGNARFQMHALLVAHARSLFKN